MNIRVVKYRELCYNTSMKKRNLIFTTKTGKRITVTGVVGKVGDEIDKLGKRGEFPIRMVSFPANPAHRLH